MNNIVKKIESLGKLIGNTPLAEISFKYKGKTRKIYAKLEYYNYTGSIKDRVALYILKKAYLTGQITSRHIIIEATSGNTGISFSAVGAYLGNEVHIYMPDWLSSERKKLLESYNAKLHLISSDIGGFKKCIELTEIEAKKNPLVFLPMQFSNEENVNAHYESTAPEIYSGLMRNWLKPSAFIAGVGTGGTVMGIGKFLKKYDSTVKVYPLEPSSSPTLSTGTKVGKHRIQGISDEFIPPILKLNDLNKVISVDDGDAIIMSQMLSKKLGLGVGISSGANFVGAIKVLEDIGLDEVVVTTFADDSKKYLSTDLMKEEIIKNEYISSKVELEGIRIL